MWFYALQALGACLVLGEFQGTYRVIKKALEKYFNSPCSREQGIISLAEFSTYLACELLCSRICRPDGACALDANGNPVSERIWGGSCPPLQPLLSWIEPSTRQGKGWLWSPESKRSQASALRTPYEGCCRPDRRINRRTFLRVAEITPWKCIRFAQGTAAPSCPHGKYPHLYPLQKVILKCENSNT